MPNRLAESNSPYLLQHAENPVEWYPWGEEALEKARREDKPIFLSIGYAACHWCHVMAHESFEDPSTAAYMNEHFVNIKVDREERPDLDNIYMNAVVALTGQGGWPMSVFLTPDGAPFYGGTYFPPVRRYNMPSFKEILEGVSRAWREDRRQVLQSGQQLIDHLQEENQSPRTAHPLQKENLEKAAMRLAQAYDWKWGGWGQAPKFPQPMTIEFLLRRAVQGDRLALDMATHALHSMAQGGMYDVVGGGFARYSTDNEWLVPHFEKMLYDNAQLARVYLHAFLITEEEFFRRVCEETLDFMLREMTSGVSEGDSDQSGGFYSSLDADSEGEEGKFYVWTLDEIRAVLGDAEAEFAIAAYGVTQAGNFEGKNVLQRALDDDTLAERFDMPVEEVQPRLDRVHQPLLQARSERVRPATDDKVLVAWNALALTALAEAARYLDRDDYLDAARQNADFLLTELNPNDRLYRSWRNGKAQHDAYLEDYAGLVLALLALYQSDPDPYWFSSAKTLLATMIEHYSDPQGGFFDTRDDAGQLITRPKDLQDNATPSGNALAATALLQLAIYEGRGDWRDMAEEMLSKIQSPAIRYPTAFGQWLSALDLALSTVQEVALLGNPGDPQMKSMINVLWSSYRPNSLAAISEFPPPANAPVLLHDRPLQNDQPTAYVCQNFVCQQPVTTAEELRGQLNTPPGNHPS